MNSGNFLARFEAGELGDEIDFIRWANKVEIYQETKAELDQMVELVTVNWCFVTTTCPITLTSKPSLTTST